MEIVSCVVYANAIESREAATDTIEYQFRQSEFATHTTHPSDPDKIFSLAS